MNALSWRARSVLQRITLIALALSLSSVAASPAAAQRPRVYAITNATVLVAPGQTLTGATVVVRNGLIEAVG
ncbi:MAG: hypothetical protein GWM93_14670, partial [Gemmatimonadetes bacterium]|nr:hypothetical protein [Gemmatimonadota bacterium]NIT67900.1 hypothetical protein [Gemmatimonadota bacterium]NIY36477.1 hypothetical protein [Gemmatimonadota bacterium]